MSLFTKLLVFIYFVISSRNLDNYTNISIVVPTPPLFTIETILNKSKDYRWTKERLLTFLILQKLHNIEFNKSYSFVENSKIKKFKKKFTKRIKEFRKFSKNAIEKNKWKINSDRVSRKIQDIENQIHFYLKNNEMFSLFHNINIGAESGSIDDKVLTWLHKLTLNGWRSLEIDLLLDKNNKLTYLMNKKYGIRKHYDEVWIHKNLLFVIYSELSKFLKDLDMVDIICHDWSKYLLDVSIGYTFLFFYTNNEKCRLTTSWNKMIKNGGTDDFFKKLFDISWKIHFKSEDHHPEHFMDIGAKECRDCANVIRPTSKQNMNQKALQESFIDMCGRQLFNLMNENRAGKEKVSYIDVKPSLFDRYNVGDAEKIINLILKLTMKYGNGDEYEKVRAEYQKYMDGRKYRTMSPN
ncbi:uncharacterized protein VNE69_08142 [Vairimorpha necatrix]|uniref:Uncharacterized protein n=1 Tax=Vairimorpha necatrix TaxID=6039 RepID=A0AAX4JEG4_9MICR